jgi:thiamine-phosphate pyrophosphorylase
MVKKGLYLVVGADNCAPHSLENVVKEAVQGGVKLVQLREKDLGTGDFIEMARLLKPLLSEHQVPLIINDRLDVAQAVGAEGVHIGQSDMSYPDARRILGYDKLIGLSIESNEQARQARELDADYIALSPIFSTPTKTDTKIEWGYDGIKTARAYLSQPLVAIGGINLTNISDVLEAGADIIAVVSAISKSHEPRQSAQALNLKIKPFS